MGVGEELLFYTPILLPIWLFDFSWFLLLSTSLVHSYIEEREVFWKDNIYKVIRDKERKDRDKKEKKGNFYQKYLYFLLIYIYISCRDQMFMPFIKIHFSGVHVS